MIVGLKRGFLCSKNTEYNYSLSVFRFPLCSRYTFAVENKLCYINTTCQSIIQQFILYTIGFNLSPSQIIFKLLMLRPSHRLQHIQTYVFYNHITQSESIWDPTLHWNINSSWICFLRGPEDGLIEVKTCCPDNILFLLYIK